MSQPAHSSSSEDKAIEEEYVEMKGSNAAASPSTVASPDEGLQFKAIVATVAAGLFWISLLYSISVLGAYSRFIVASLGSKQKQAWIFNAFNVVTVSVAPVLSYLSDIYGRKWLIVSCMVFGVIGGAIGGRATSVNMVIVGSTLTGIASAAIGMCTAIPSEVLPHRHRSTGQSLVFAMAALGSFPSLIGMGSAIKNDPVNGWRWIYYTFIILWGLQIPLWVFAYSPPRRDTQLTRARPALDWLGYVLLTGGIVLVLMGLTWGGGAYAWKSGQVLGTLCTGIVVLIVFGLWEWRFKKDGILHHGLFMNRNFPLAVLSTLVEGFVYLGFSTLYPGEVATVYESDLVKAGALALPFHCMKLVGLACGALFVFKTKDNVTPVLCGFIGMCGAAIGFCLANPSNKTVFVVMDGLAGFTFSWPVTYLTVIAQFASPGYLIGTSTALNLSARALGGAVGVAVVTNILNSRTAKNIPKYISGAVLPLGLPTRLLGTVIGAAASSNPATIAKVQAIPGVGPDIMRAAIAGKQMAFSKSYQTCWIPVIVASALGALCILSLQRNKHQLDRKIDAPLVAVEGQHSVETAELGKQTAA